MRTARKVFGHKFILTYRRTQKHEACLALARWVVAGLLPPTIAADMRSEIRKKCEVVGRF